MTYLCYLSSPTQQDGVGGQKVIGSRGNFHMLSEPGVLVADAK